MNPAANTTPGRNELVCIARWSDSSNLVQETTLDSLSHRCLALSRAAVEGAFLQIEHYLRLRPYLYHLTHRRNLKHIREIGRLFSASVLMKGSGKADLIRTRRNGSEPVTFVGRKIFIRDQDPLYEGHMTLPDEYTLADFVAHLNKRIFFWPGTDKRPVPSGMGHFKRYAKEKPVILRIDCKALLARNPKVVPLFCLFNSGSPRCSPPDGRKSPRGPDIFQSAAEFNEPPGRVVEVTFESEVVLPANSEVGSHPEGPWRAFL
jgi:hypothetical protein